MAITLAGCTGPDDPEKQKPSDFTSAALPGAGGDKAAAGAQADSPANGMARQVEEADIVKDDGAGHLYVVNAYRGLEIIDVSNPDAPKLVGRSPILGHPVDMYLANGLAYVIVSDYFDWWWDPQNGLDDFHGSQIKVVDVSTPSAPRPLTAFRLDGFISDTRRVGDVIYAVSNVYSWLQDPMNGNTPMDSTYVVSIDVANPMNPRVVQRIDFDGSANRILATANSLYVAQPKWVGGGMPTGITHVQLVDISDPAGAMKMGGAIDVPGYLDSKFQMDDLNGVLRILTHDGGWGAQGSQRLSTFAVANNQLAPLGALDLPQSGGLFGVRFDGTRAYFATLVTRDPLEIVDLTDPKHPTLLSSLEIPGTLQQIIPEGDRLIALGSQNNTWQGVAVSLFDVSDGAKPALLSSAPVGGSNAWTQAFWDDKSLKVIESLQLVAVPFEAWTGNTYEAGLQLVDYSQSAVRARGRIEQLGSILRATPVGNRLGTLSEISFETSDITDRDNPRVIGNVELVRNVIDFARVGTGAAELLGPRDYTKPGETLRLRTVTLDHADDGQYLAELSLPEQSGWLHANGSMLYVVGQGWDAQSGQYHLKLHVIDASDLSHPRERGAATISFGQNEWYAGLWDWSGRDDGMLLVDGSLFVLVAQRSFQDNSGNWTSEQRLHVIDVSNADAPAEVSTPTIGASWSWNAMSDGRMVYLTHAEVAAGNPQPNPPVVRDYMDRVDLTDPAHPQVLAKVNIPGVLVAVADSGRRIYTLDYQWNGQNPTNTFDTLTVLNDKAYLDQAMAVPAEVGDVRVSGGDAYFTSRVWWWQQQGNNPAPTTTTLHTVDVRDAENGNMREVSSATLTGFYTLRGLAGAHLFLETGGNWWWGGVAAGAGAVPAGGIACVADDVYGCGYSGGDSIALFDASNPDKPAYTGVTRVNGWVRSIVADVQSAYLPTGFYGVQSISLLGQSH